MDFARLMRELRGREPVVIFSPGVGAGTAEFYKAYRQAGFDPSRMPIASLTTSEAEIAQMDPEDAVGHITAAPFFDTLTTASTKAFVSAYKLKYGQDSPIPAGAEAAYFQTHLFANALRVVDTDAPEPLLGALKGMEFDAPQGRVKIDPETNHSYVWPRIGRVGETGGFDVVWSSNVAIKPDPYFLAPSVDDWANVALESRRA